MNLTLTERDKKLLGLTACLAILAVFGVHLIRPALAEHEALGSEYEAALRKQQEYQAQIDARAALDDSIAQNEAALKTAGEPYYPDDLETRQMDDIITGIALKNGLFPQSLTLTEAVPGAVRAYLAVQEQADGSASPAEGADQTGEEPDAPQTDGSAAPDEAADQTGSGKSTTLYMVLEYLSRRQVNISTVEDPVEQNVPGINQTQVNPVAGLTFESGLRALLRQDPDIIMVGETRDGETAGISVRAAITGHLVLSTLHTNDAVSSVVRLADMGVDRYLIANSLVGLVAQRLMRKVCPHCAREAAVTPQEQALLGRDIRTVRRGAGCMHCNGTGYRGRVAVHEIVAVDRSIRRMISRGAEAEEIEAYAREHQGMKSLREKGLELVREGVTTPEELLRIAYYA